MKTIKERALDYAIDYINKNGFDSSARIETDVDDLPGILGNMFIAGAKSEHEELTRWNSPDVHPELDEDGIDRLVLLKFHYGNYEVGFYDRHSGYWSDEDNNKVIILCWREIHE